MSDDRPSSAADPGEPAPAPAPEPEVPATDPPAAPLAPPRHEALALVTLWTAGVSWPLLSSLAADGPALVARQVSAPKLTLLAVGVSLLAPAALVGLIALSRRSAGAPLRVLRPTAVCALLAATLLHLANLNLPQDGSVSGDVLVVLSALLAGGAAAAFLTWAPLRRALALASPCALLVLGMFLADADVRGLLGGLTGAPAAAPVVLVVLDEVPMDSLLDEQGGIDRDLFPNLARVAARGVLFDNASTVHENRVTALEALLTGQRLGTEGEPAETLFTLLGTTHRPYVWGPLARDLCPSALLAGHGAPPGRLARDATSAWARAVLPPPFDAVGARSPGRWHPPKDQGAPIVTTPRPPSPTNGLDRVAAFREFIAALDDEHGPPLAVIHTGLPSRPWNRLPDTSRYALSGPAEGLVDGRWNEHPWPAARGTQRHLLQLGAADRLIGELLDALEQRGLLERAVLAVTATGGASFAPDSHLAVPSLVSAPDVLSVPLILAAPSLADRAGTTSDRNVELFDLAPTLAELLQRPVDPAWDGDSLFATTEQPPFKTADRVYGPAVVLSGEAPLRRPARERRIELFGRGGGWDAVFGLAPMPGLVGRTVEQLGVVGLHPATAQVHSVHGGADELPLLLRGQVMARTAAELPEMVAVSVDGRVVAASATSPGTGAQATFGVLLPPDALAGGGTRSIGLFAPGGDGSLAVLEVVVWDLERDEVGAPRRIVGSNGRVLQVRPDAFGAVLDLAEPVGDGVRLEGWAADRLLGRPADALLVFVDGSFVRAGSTGVERIDLLPQLQDQALAGAGFDFVVPAELLAEGFMSRTQVFAVVDDLATEVRSGRDARWLTEVTWILEGRELIGTDGRRVHVGDADVWGSLERAHVVDDQLWLAGWAFDAARRTPVDELLVLVDGKSLLSVKPGDGKGVPVAPAVGGEVVQGAGFLGHLPLSWLDGAPDGRVVVLAVRGDRAARLHAGPAASWVDPRE